MHYFKKMMSRGFFEKKRLLGIIWNLMKFIVTSASAGFVFYSPDESEKEVRVLQFSTLADAEAHGQPSKLVLP